MGEEKSQSHLNKRYRAAEDPFRSRFSWLPPVRISWYSREALKQRILFP